MRFINFLGSLYSKFPKFNIELKDFIVKILPWIVIFGGVLIAFASITEMVGSPLLSIFNTNGGLSILKTLLFVNVLGVIQGVLMIAAFKPLRRKSNNGWRLVFWSQLLWIIGALISFSPSILLGFLFLYPLYQVKSYYR
jgi:hypothetical protein